MVGIPHPLDYHFNVRGLEGSFRETMVLGLSKEKPRPVKVPSGVHLPWSQCEHFNSLNIKGTLRPVSDTPISQDSA